jgi:hypothetical protein
MLTLSPNGSKWDSTWPMSPMCSLGVPKWFSSSWYIRRKLCTYLALILTLYPNGPKWDSTWPTSPRCSIIKLALSQKTLKRSSTRASSPRSTIGCVQNNFRTYGTLCQTMHLSCVLALSANRPKRASTWASSPRTPIGCVQIDFWAYGTFGANRAPILHWC